MLFAAITGEDALYCCGMCPILPLVVVLAIVAMFRNSLWASGLACLVAVVPYVILQVVAALYEPSLDGEEEANQFTGRSALGFFDWVVAIAGLSLLMVTAIRVVGRKRQAPSGDVPRLK